MKPIILVPDMISKRLKRLSLFDIFTIENNKIVAMGLVALYLVVLATLFYCNILSIALTISSVSIYDLSHMEFTEYIMHGGVQTNSNGK